MENSKPTEETWNQPSQQLQPEYTQDNKRVLTGILAILFGSIGIHKFVLGYNNEGIILLVATAIGYATLCFLVGGFILTATGIIGLVEGIIYLTKTDAQFYEMYQKNKKPWF
jgi:TM2 domain-containing membrane protein YozV